MKQHQDYDKIFKESFHKIGISLLSKICGINDFDFEDTDTTFPKKDIKHFKREG